jgi:hypothetical protein
MPTIEINGLDELRRKFGSLTAEIRREMHQTMEKSLNILVEKVPPYPPASETSNYRRTGTLGKSIGVGQGAKPTVYSIKGSGGNIHGRFGTDLSYAQYVIDPERQAYMHQGRWWTMDTIKERAEEKIKKAWELMISKLLNRQP